MSGSNVNGETISQLPAASQVNPSDLLPLTQGSSGPGTGTTRSAPVSALATEIATILNYTDRNQARAQLQWSNNTVVYNGNAFFVYNAPYAGTINSLDYACTTGTFTAQVLIGGTPVTGLSAVAVSGTGANAAATGANTFAQGAQILVAISAASGSPTNAILALRLTWN